MSIKFTDLNLSSDILKAVAGMGFETTTPIQAAAIPEIINGRDIVGQASTGTGKTAAFGLPLIDKIDSNSRDVQALIMCPTRELAIQVASEITKFLKFKNGISALPIYGGQPIERQFYGLRRGPQIIIGTPGRIMDHLERRSLNFKNVKTVVLDEADEMLNMGFRQDIEEILKSVKTAERQTLLFSATMSPEILSITKRFQKDPIVIKIKAEKVDTSLIKQLYFNVERPYKIDYLMDLINKYNPKLAIVFCNTKRWVDKLAKTLEVTGFMAAGIHGDIRQAKRDSIMARFRKGKVNILVATDVAARGLDISDVDVIFNYELPKDVESYVHRIGRTGRAGKSGFALNLVSREESMQLRRIMQFTRLDIEKSELSVDNKSSEISNKKLEVRAPKEIKIQKDFSAKKEIKSDYIVADNYQENKLERKAIKVLTKVKQNLENKDHSEYLTIADGFVSNNYSHAQLSAALLKLLIESDSESKFPARFR
ncbi:MAG: DNA/RNA helicase, superfamily II [candidate division TM6 bacterium GW2011_GWF2_28_16]|nr:MAG: DNA/RNA helicase, superfamily II [candidate division TM6 bacterium GW2011_GWF2_28_16]